MSGSDRGICDGDEADRPAPGMAFCFPPGMMEGVVDESFPLPDKGDTENQAPWSSHSPEIAGATALGVSMTGIAAERSLSNFEMAGMDAAAELSPTLLQHTAALNSGTLTMPLDTPPFHGSMETWLSDGTELHTPSSTSTSQLPPPILSNRTILTMENLDPHTRTKILEILCQHKVATKIEIE